MQSAPVDAPRQYCGIIWPVFGLEIEFGTEVTSIEDAPDGVRVTLDRGGNTETVAAAYVLGAGAPIAVTRHSMHEQLAGDTYDGRYFVADATIRLPGPPECGRLIVGPTGFVLLSPLPDQRMLIFVNRDYEDMQRELPHGSRILYLLNCRTGIEVELGVNAGAKMHRRAGVIMHRDERTEARTRGVLVGLGYAEESCCAAVSAKRASRNPERTVRFGIIPRMSDPGCRRSGCRAAAACSA